MGQSPFWWMWVCTTLAILLFLFLRIKVTPEPGNGSSKFIMLLFVLASALLSYYLGLLSGATDSHVLTPKKDNIYEVISKSFVSGTNTCIVLQPTKLGIATMEWYRFSGPKIYSLPETITNEPNTRVIGVTDDKGVVHLTTHPLQPTTN